MASLMLVNPRRKRKSAPRKKVASNPKRRRRTTHRRRARRNPVAANPKRRRRSMHRRRARRNPKISLSSLQRSVVVPAAMMGAGAVAVDVAYSALPLPANLKTGIAGSVAKFGVAVVAGMLAQKFLGKKIGEAVMLGGVATQVYGLVKPQVQKMLPSLTLGEYINGMNGWEYAPPMSQLGYVNAAEVVPSSDIPYSPNSIADGMGEYINGYGGY